MGSASSLVSSAAMVAESQRLTKVVAALVIQETDKIRMELREPGRS